MKNLAITGLAAAVMAGAASSAFAGNVNILWYTGVAGGAITPTYVANIETLATQEENPLFNVSGSVNTWNITFWNGGAQPAGAYNVLVAASPEGGWTQYPNYTSLAGAITGAGGTSSYFGSRVMLTGQDADWHYQNNPGPGNFNGPAGFLIDAINWAGSGSGMGGVMLATGDELDGGGALPGQLNLYSYFAGSGHDAGYDDSVNIPAAYSTYPINLGLTSAGLSGWETSAHESFMGYDPTLWTAINEGATLADPITIVSAQFASGGTGGSGVPDNGLTLAMMALGLAGLGVYARRTAKA